MDLQETDAATLVSPTAITTSRDLSAAFTESIDTWNNTIRLLGAAFASVLPADGRRPSLLQGNAAEMLVAGYALKRAGVSSALACKVITHPLFSKHFRSETLQFVILLPELFEFRIVDASGLAGLQAALGSASFTTVDGRQCRHAVIVDLKPYREGLRKACEITLARTVRAGRHPCTRFV